MARSVSLNAARPVILPIVASVLAGVIFVADTVTDLEIAMAVFYVAVVLLSVTFCKTRGVLLISLGCAALTVLSYAFTLTGSPQSGLINSVISISAIAATTYLVLKIESATIAVHEARAQLAHIGRLTTLGELTASIAHEVNQPLTGVITSSNACIRWLAADPPNIEKARHTGRTHSQGCHTRERGCPAGSQSGKKSTVASGAYRRQRSYSGSAHIDADRNQREQYLVANASCRGTTADCRRSR